jgi:hypothetical protein
MKMQVFDLEELACSREGCADGVGRRATAKMPLRRLK